MITNNLDSLVCIILCGGKGTRLQSVVQDVPKPMADIDGEPFISLLVKRLVNQGVRKFVLSVGYKRESIIGYFKSHNVDGVEIMIAEEETPLGTGGGIRNAAMSLNSDQYLVLNGDSTCAADIAEFVSAVGVSGLTAGVLVNHQSDCARYGRIVFNQESHRTEKMEEKNPDAGAGYINAGVYLLSRDFIVGLPCGAFSFEEVGFPLLMTDGLLSYEGTSKFIDIGVPDDYYALCENKYHYFSDLG